MGASSWLSGFNPSDYLPAAEMSKGWGCFYDHTTSGTDASLAITVPTWGSDLRFVYQAVADNNGDFWMRFNADTGANYDCEVVETEFGITTSADNLAQTKILIPGVIQTAPANCFGDITIPNYRGAVLYKTGTCIGGFKPVGALYLSTTTFSWNSAAAITTVTFLPASGNLVTGSRIRGYVSG